MNDALLVSNIFLWVVTLALVVVVMALARQIGILYERVAPMGALMLDQGPKVGEMAPVFNLDSIGGGSMNKIEHWEFADEDPMDEETKQMDTAPKSVYGFGHLPYYRNVFDVLDGKAEPMCDGREGRKTVEIISSAYIKSKKDK